MVNGKAGEAIKIHAKTRSVQEVSESLKVSGTRARHLLMAGRISVAEDMIKEAGLTDKYFAKTGFGKKIEKPKKEKPVKAKKEGKAKKEAAAKTKKEAAPKAKETARTDETGTVPGVERHTERVLVS